jgi:hypothetical protein
MPDASLTTVTVVLGIRQHTVTHYGGCRDTPAALGDIERRIDTTADVARWLAPRS